MSTSWRRLVARVRELLAGRGVRRDLSDELGSHLECLTDEYVRRGLSPDDARRAAQRDFGGPGSAVRAAEAVLDKRGFRPLETLMHDVRYACRLLVKARGFTALAVLTLALGIGVNTAIFSLVDAVMLRPLPYPDADRLVSVWEQRMPIAPSRLSTTGTGIGAAGAEPTRMVVAPATLIDLQRRTTQFSGLAGESNVGRNLTGTETPERLLGEEVTSNYFSVLNVSPSVGRVFSADEDRPGAAKVVILSDGLWRGRLNADPNIVGRTIALDGEACEILGVMPPDFQGVSQFGQSDPISFWVPAAYPPDLLANHGDHEINVIGRLKSNGSLASARVELATIAAGLARTFPDTNTGVSAHANLLRDDIVRRVRTSLNILLLAVGLILLVACVNVANLLIVRAVSRRREVAVRLALGASRFRIMSELITQSGVLAALACGVGLLFGRWTVGVLVSIAPQTLPRLHDAALDGRVLAFSAGLAVLTTVTFGILPAWQASRSRPVEALRTCERVVAGTGVLRWRGALMIAEIAISAVLLVGATLMLRSLAAFNAVDLGFDPHRVLAMNVNLPETRYPTADDRLRFFETLAERVSRLPGVESLGFANRFPLRGGWGTGIQIDGVPNAQTDGRGDADFQAVSPGYFVTLAIPLIRGRLLTPDDRTGRENAAVVSEAFGRWFLQGRDPIGTRMRRGAMAPWITVVGVVRDVRRDGRGASIKPQVYLSAAQTNLYPVRLADVAVRASGDLSALPNQLRAQVLAIDPEQPITNVRTLEEILGQRVADRRFQTLLFTLFAGLALALAAIGIYGVVSYAVAQRTPEIGIRIALGADRGRILRWILLEASWLVAAGIVAGLGAAWGLARFVESLLFEVSRADVATYVVAAGTLAAAALTATYAGARRATSIDPVTALR